jgi:hypothetical protein
VDFLLGDAVVATAAAAPYAALWTNPPVGVWNLRARAVDAVDASAVSEPVRIRVSAPASPPVLVRTFPELTTNAGTHIELEVETLSTSPVTYQWYIDGRPIPDFDQARLVLPLTGAGNSGRYTVVARNASGSVTSAPVTQTFLLQPEVFWQRQHGGQPIQPSIGPRGQLCFPGRGTVRCVDRAGTLLWVHPAGFGPGIPVGPDGSILVPTEAARITSVDADGRDRWSAVISGIFRGAARNADGTVYVTTGNGFLEAWSDAGTNLWRLNIGAGIDAAPVIGTEGSIVFGAADGRVRAVSPAGVIRWEYDAGIPVGRTAAIRGDGAIVVPADRRLLVINRDGTRAWQMDLPGAVAPAIIGPDGAIHVGHMEQAVITQPETGRALVLNADGTVRWSTPLPYPVRLPGALAADGTWYLPSGPLLIALNPNGTERFRHPTDSSTAGSPMIGFDGTVYVSGSGTLVYALRGTTSMPGNGWPSAGRDVRNRSDAASASDPDTWFFPSASNGFDEAVDAILQTPGRLFVGGRFRVAGGRPAAHIAGWDGTNWFPLGPGLDGPVRKIVAWGTNLVVLGTFPGQPDTVPPQVRIWNGSEWSTPLEGLVELVHDLVVHAGDLCVISTVRGPGSPDRFSLFRLESGRWTPVGQPLPSRDYVALASGPSGLHTVLGNAVLRFDGTNWTQVGPRFNDSVSCLLDTATGLYAGGAFRLGGAGRGGLARWSGTQWLNVGGGLGPGEFYSGVSRLAADGTNLFAAGYFTLPGGTNITRLARWNGRSWSQAARLEFYPGAEESRINAMAVGDGEIFVGGDFLRLDSRLELRHFAAFREGAGWTSLGPRVLTVDSQLRLFLSNFLGRPFTVESSEDLVRWREAYRFEQLDRPVQVPTGDPGTADTRFFRIVVP